MAVKEKNEVSRKTGEGEKNKNLHGGHRERKREQFFYKEFDDVPEHEVLEVLLYFSNKRRDTNEIAHKLIDRFKSLNGVINAGYDELVTVDDVGDATAYMICFFRRLAMLYLKNERKGSVIELNNTETLSEYCRILFKDARCEQLRIIFLNDDLVLIDDKLLGNGTPGRINVSFRVIAEEIMKQKCSRVVISHNHPIGTCIPSNADINYTYNLWQALKPLEIELIDHIIIGSDGEWSMRSHSSLPEVWAFK